MESSKEREEKAKLFLDRLYEAMINDGMKMTDEEWLEETKEDGEDYKDNANRITALAENAFMKFAQKRMQEAKAGYEKQKTQSQSKTNILTFSIEKKLKLIREVQSKHPEQILAARNEKSIQADPDSLIEDYLELGLLNEDGLIK